MVTPLNYRKDFERDGYIAIKPLFDADKIAEINHELARFIDTVVPTMPSSHVYYEDINDKSSLKQIQKMFEHDTYFADLMKKGIVPSIAEHLLQDKVRPVNMQYFNKPPCVGQATPAHQDGFYFHLNPCAAVTGWLALEPVDEENGCVRYVRGSHNSDTFRPHGYTGLIGFSQGITDFGTSEDIDSSVSIEGDAGTFLMHHARTIHYAGENKSTTRSRHALGFIYYADQAKEDTESQKRYQATLEKSLLAAGKI